MIAPEGDDPLLKPMKWRPGLAAGAVSVMPAAASRPAGLLLYFDQDLRPARDVNDWLTHLVTTRAIATVNEYGRAVARFANYLESTYSSTLLGPEVTLGGDGCLRNYNAHLVRAHERADSPAPVGASRVVIGKTRAALMSFYRHCVVTRRLSEFPFALTTVRTRNGEVQTLAFMQGGRITNGVRDAIPRAQLVRYYRVGLLGELPDGGVDPTFQSFTTSQRNAAGFGLGVALGLRHNEILGTTVFEVPNVDPDGLTPARVANAIAKRRHGRRIVGLSSWLTPVHRYIAGDRRDISRRASWHPDKAWLVVPERTNRDEVVLISPRGSEHRVAWNEADHELRRRMVIPGYGSPLVLLDHRKRNGAPLTDVDSLNAGFAKADERCRRYWPTLGWKFTAHHLRHTFATELTQFLSESDQRADDFIAEFGRTPDWVALLDRQDKSRIVQESMGHQDIRTTNRYREGAFWSLLLSVAADPAHNPAVRKDFQ